jgi:hypothetical protein
MNRLALGLTMTLSAVSCFSQVASTAWRRADRTDPATGAPVVEFRLDGEFLKPPQGSEDNEPPVLLLRCVPGEKAAGRGSYVSGSLIDAHVHVGAALSHRAGGLTVSYRLNGGKARKSVWDRSTDGTAAFLPNEEVDRLFRSNSASHNKKSGDAARRVVVSVHQDQAAEVVMEFDLPEDQSTYDACGLVRHPR